MVDTKTYKMMHGSTGDTSKRDELEEREMDGENPPEEPFILLLPATIKGFGLHNKKWSKCCNKEKGVAIDPPQTSYKWSIYAR
jgi:hypothetical protein